MSTESMQVMAQTLDSFLNGDGRGNVGEREIGFALLVFPINQVRDGMVNYVGNCQRADMLVALKEMVARWEGQPEIIVKTVQ